MPDLFPEDLIDGMYSNQSFQIFHSLIRMNPYPLLESTELFSRSVTTLPIVNKELYSFLDRNEDSISLRPEGSKSVSVQLFKKNRTGKT